MTLMEKYEFWMNCSAMTDELLSELRSMNQDQITLSRYLTEEDSLLAMTNESLLYLMSEAAISGASTQGTSAFDQLFLDYLEEHPDKYPTVVAVDKMLDIYPYYYNPEENSVLLNWIRDEFPNTELVETDYLTLSLIR